MLPPNDGYFLLARRAIGFSATTFKSIMSARVCNGLSNFGNPLPLAFIAINDASRCAFSHVARHPIMCDQPGATTPHTDMASITCACCCTVLLRMPRNVPWL